jgi:single-strand DNA-binding protein
MNNCVLIGNLGADPESIYTDEGTHIVNFSLAFRSTRKDKSNWIKIVCFEKLAELALKYLHKGARIAISGKLDQNKWTDNNNQTKTMHRIIANNITFIKTDGRGFENGENTDNGEQDSEVPPF